MKSIRATLFFAIAVLCFTSSCLPIIPRDPLPASQGWRYLMAREYREFDGSIKPDYQSYIQQLPSKERDQVTDSSIQFFGNRDDEHAVYFETTRRGFWSDITWSHVLIYDASNRRIKVMHYRSGRSRS